MHNNIRNHHSHTPPKDNPWRKVDDYFQYMGPEALKKFKGWLYRMWEDEKNTFPIEVQGEMRDVPFKSAVLDELGHGGNGALIIHIKAAAAILKFYNQQPKGDEEKQATSKTEWVAIGMDVCGTAGKKSNVLILGLTAKYALVIEELEAALKKNPKQLVTTTVDGKNQFVPLESVLKKMPLKATPVLCCTRGFVKHLGQFSPTVAAALKKQNYFRAEAERRAAARNGTR